MTEEQETELYKAIHEELQHFLIEELKHLVMNKERIAELTIGKQIPEQRVMDRTYSILEYIEGILSPDSDKSEQ